MGKQTDITITHHDSRSRASSVASHDRDLHADDGVPVDPPLESPSLSVAHAAASRSGSSSHHGEPPVAHDYVRIRLPYPHEVNEERDDLDRNDQLSRIQSRDRGGTRHTSRSGSIHRAYSQHTHSREPPRARPQHPPHSPTESGDSTEDFLARPGPHPMPRPSHYDPLYPHSNSSGSYYGQQPMNQVVAHQPAPHPYPQYPMQGPPPPAGYPPPSHMSYPQYPPHAPHPGSQISSPYAPSPYGPGSMVPSQYGVPSYFPPQHQLPYGHAYPPPQQYPPHYMQGYPQHVPMPMPSYVDPLQVFRVQSPAVSSPATASDTAKDKYDQEELMKRFESLMKQQTDDKKEAEVTKEDALKQAMEQMRADSAAAAAAAAQRSAEESRMKEEARQEILRAIEDEKKRAAEQSAREEQIRKDAAEAALKAAEATAKAQAERVAAEKKIAEDAAAAAKTAAEKEAAEAAAAKETEAKKAQEEALAKLKEAEEAAAKAKAEAEAAEKKAAENAPPEKKAPVRFRDAIGRNYNFPFERCHKWRDMEALINQAFAHVENMADWVYRGNYDLLGPDGEIIMPEYWRETIQPDMQITMMLWEFPEKDDKDPDAVPMPVGEDGILNLDDILNPGGGGGGGGGGEKRRKKKAASKPSGLASWMLGGAAGKRHLKGDKKPDVAAASQHGAEQSSGCTVM